MREPDASYYKRRAFQEQVAAAAANCQVAADRHDELAMMYRFRVAMLTKGPDAWASALQPVVALAPAG